MRLNLKAGIVAVFACAVALSLCACSSGGDTAAKFGDHTITETQVNDYTAQFRAGNGYSEDADWAEYLTEQELTVETWRESAIRQLAQEALVADKAKELGFTADEEDVESRIEQLKATYATDDESKWTAYLERRGLTEDSLRESYRNASLAQQVLKQEVEPSIVNDTAMTNDYLQQNCFGRSFRSYAAVTFKKEDKAQAQKVLNELKALPESQLQDAFDKAVKEYSVNEQASIGVDAQMDMSAAENGEDLNAALLKPGQLFQELLVTDDAVQIILCTGKTTVQKDFDINDMENSELKTYLVDLSVAANYTAACSKYLAELVDNANVMITELPAEVPYDVSE